MLKSIKKPINADYSTFTEKNKTNPKAPKFKVNERMRIVCEDITNIKLCDKLHI